jgi:hypothetical protein
LTIAADCQQRLLTLNQKPTTANNQIDFIYPGKQNEKKKYIISPIEFQITVRLIPKQAPNGVEQETLRIILKI